MLPKSVHPEFTPRREPEIEDMGGTRCSTYENPARTNGYFVELRAPRERAWPQGWPVLFARVRSSLTQLLTTMISSKFPATGRSIRNDLPSGETSKLACPALAR